MFNPAKKTFPLTLQLLLYIFKTSMWRELSVYIYIYWLVAYQNNIPPTSILDELDRTGVHNYHYKQ
jgi:hypothetical protein